MDGKHYVYILRCSDDTLYTGYTVNLQERLEKHNQGKGAKYTRGRGPFELAHFEEFTTKEEAMKREWQIKQLTREQKISIIKGSDASMDVGKLYLCATPIGNLEDITLRVLRTLKEVDLIAAEDTRHTRKLLSYYDIHMQLTSYHEHNKKVKGPQLIEKLLAGMDIALVTDAGTPGISDPGHDLVMLAIAQNIPVIALPGPSAFINALIISGLPTDEFVFFGFLPTEKKLRRNKLEQLTKEQRTMVLYEAPHRLKNTLDDLNKVLEDREAVIVRELTKKFEDVKRGNLEELLAYYENVPPKGEICIVIKGSPDVVATNDSTENNIEIEKHVQLFFLL